jgi:regulator of sigma E protease
MSPDEYRSASWLAAWDPGNLPPLPRSGWLGIGVSVAILLLIAVSAFNGSSLAIFLALMSLAVVLHEAGHLFAARRVGVPVLAFVVGVGPLVRSVLRRTRSLPLRIDVRLLPLLGYVQPYAVPRGVWDHWQDRDRRAAAGEPPPPLPRLDPGEKAEPVFLFVSRPRRLVFLTGGLAVNLISAVAFLWLYETASPQANLVTAPVAGPVPPGSLAAKAGIVEGDRFVAVGGAPVTGFFDVRRRLAPIARDGSAAPVPDPAGSVVQVEIERDRRRITLEWRTPDRPPVGDPGATYGLLPPESWIVERVQTSAARLLRPGDEIVAIALGERRYERDVARQMLADAFAKPDGPKVRLIVRRGGSEFIAPASPWRDEGGDATAPARAPFELERLREPGPRAGLVDVVAKVLSRGWDSIVGLPREVASSLRSAPSREERGWLLAEVRKDPWVAARTFAFIHAFLLFLNLVPIPPLDGFQILCCLLEMAARRPLPDAGVRIAMRTGWAILVVWLAVNAFLVLRDLTLSVAPG